MFKRKSSSEELIRLLKGSPKEMDLAIRSITRNNYKQIKSYVNRNGGMGTDAEELLQVVLTGIIEKLRDGKDVLIKDLNAYVFTACKNRWINTQKRAIRQVAFNPEIHDQKSDWSSESPLKALEEEETRSIVHQLLDKLGDKCKYLLIWSLGEGIDMKSVARDLNYENAETAMNIKSRCKKRLKELVNGHETYKKLVYQIIFSDKDVLT